MIQVTNQSSAPIQVGINQWGTGPNETDMRDIARNSDEFWRRSDRRGFVMAVARRGDTLPYYVYFDSVLEITDSTVRDQERGDLEPIGPPISMS